MGLTPASEQTGTGLGELIGQLRHIADVLESHQVVCGEKLDAARCGLQPLHKGYHITADGRTRWLEDE